MYPSSGFSSTSSGNVVSASATAVDEVTIALMPMFHQYGILTYIAHHLTLGFKLIIMNKFDVELYLHLATKYEVLISLS